MHLINFRNTSLYTRAPLRTFHVPSKGLGAIERYFEDYKSQINNRLAGTDQPTRQGCGVGVEESEGFSA